MIHVLTGGVVRAMAGEREPAQAIAWSDDRILAVGSEADVLAKAGPDAHVRRIPGRAVVPGFLDAHQHLSLEALYGGSVPCRVDRLESLVARLREAAGRLGDGEWVVGTGYDELLLRERRHPTREDLDAACPDRPVYLGHYTWHEAVVNSRALERCGIGRDTPDPPGGVIERDRRGHPTGRLIETAISRAESSARRSLVARDAEGFLARLRRHEDGLLAAGITRICDAAVPAGIEALYREAVERGILRIGVVVMPVADDGYLLPPLSRLDGPRTGEGNERLRVGPLKMVADGATRCAQCLSLWQCAGMAAHGFWLALTRFSFDSFRIAGQSAPVFRGGKIRSGIRFFEPEAVSPFVRRSTGRGFGIAIHAEGNEGIDAAVAALGAARGAPGLRIEHGTFLDDGRIRRIADLGIAVVTQPDFLSLPAFEALPGIPGLRVMPIRSLRSAGVCVAGSSDAPVIPADPLRGIRAAVSRRTPRGRKIAADEAVDPIDALALYTREAARAAGCLDFCGTLERGKRADLVVLSVDPATDAEKARVLETIVGGTTRFGQAT